MMMLGFMLIRDSGFHRADQLARTHDFPTQPAEFLADGFHAGAGAQVPGLFPAKPAVKLLAVGQVMLGGEVVHGR